MVEVVHDSERQERNRQQDQDPFVATAVVMPRRHDVRLGGAINFQVGCGWSRFGCAGAAAGRWQGRGRRRSRAARTGSGSGPWGGGNKWLDRPNDRAAVGELRRLRRSADPGEAESRGGPDGLTARAGRAHGGYDAQVLSNRVTSMRPSVVDRDRSCAKCGGRNFRHRLGCPYALKLMLICLVGSVAAVALVIRLASPGTTLDWGFLVAYGLFVLGFVLLNLTMWRIRTKNGWPL